MSGEEEEEDFYCGDVTSSTVHWPISFIFLIGALGSILVAVKTKGVVMLFYL